VAHLNLKLADEHVPYRNLRITLPFAGDIEEVYTHPPTSISSGRPMPSSSRERHAGRRMNVS
jgi:hypothetical protein